MSNLHWYVPLERCSTLDDIRSQWHALLEQNRMTPAHNVPRYQDAMLSFLGRSTLAPHLKLAAMLACGSTFDFDFRLAVGLLEELTHELDVPWPDSVAEAVMPNGPALPDATDDAWLGAFVVGRLVGLRETFTHDGMRAEAWRATFWNKFLEMACRHANKDAVRLALQHGADPRFEGHAAVLTPAQGVHLGFLDESGHLTDDRTNADYEGILLQLVAGGLAHGEMLAAALPTAATVDNTDMLDFLLAQGADIRADGARPLAAAARNAAYEALGWLIEHGADVHADGEAALIAAVASLDEGAVEMLLAAGADLHACGEVALRTALTSCPYELYAGEPDLVGPRADMVALLLRHGVRPSSEDVIDALMNSSNGKQPKEHS
jgi:hypothetical protein